MTKSERRKMKTNYNDVYRRARIKIFKYLKSKGISCGRHKVPQHEIIYEFITLIGHNIENPTKNSIKDWVVENYKKQEIEELKKVEQGFYLSIEWLKLRKQVLSMYDRKCMCCGSTEYIHVDHIKPRSLFKELELDINNMQLLCRSCNTRKSNRDFTDYRLCTSVYDTLN